MRYYALRSNADKHSLHQLDDMRTEPEAPEPETPTPCESGAKMNKIAQHVARALGYTDPENCSAAHIIAGSPNQQIASARLQILGNQYWQAIAIFDTRLKHLQRNRHNVLDHAEPRSKTKTKELYDAALAAAKELRKWITRTERKRNPIFTRFTKALDDAAKTTS